MPDCACVWFEFAQQPSEVDIEVAQFDLRLNGKRLSQIRRAHVLSIRGALKLLVHVESDTSDAVTDRHIRRLTAVAVR